MAITVGQDTYSTVADANDYLTLHYGTTLSDDTATAEALLKRATTAIDVLYGERFIGVRTTDNPLEWPRFLNEFGKAEVVIGYSNTGRALENPVPREVKNATIELAYSISQGVDVYAQPAPVLKQESVDVGDVSRTLVFQDSGYMANFLHRVKVIIAPVLRSTGGLRLVK